MKKLISFKILYILLVCVMLCSVAYTSFSVALSIKSYVEGREIVLPPHEYEGEGGGGGGTGGGSSGGTTTDVTTPRKWVSSGSSDTTGDWRSKNSGTTDDPYIHF